VAAGADGLIVEVHANPEEALCDGAQSLRPSDFETLASQCRAVAEAIGRTL
jgi:3-deoxy-7-phosphoheptulonate synthase